MLTLQKPEIEILGEGGARLRASFECDGHRGEIWYSTQSEFAPYLCDELGDAFVLPMLFYAMKRNHGLTLEVPISERFYFTVMNYLQQALVHIFKDWHQVPIIASTSSKVLQNLGAVGTGLSCGIDSFSTIVKHTSEAQSLGYRLTHCTFFDVGGHSPLSGDSEVKAALFNHRVARAQKCAKDLSLPLVVLTSNLDEIVPGAFASTHTYRNVSAVLALQKLFKIYYYSSGHSAFDIKFEPQDSGDYDVFSLPLVSTETVTFFSAGALDTRITKTEAVASYSPSHRYLNVCLFEDANCSKCEKCLRTLLTLDILGKLSLYREVFDLALYYMNKQWFVGYVFAGRNRNPHYREIVDAMVKTGFRRKRWISSLWSWYWFRLVNKAKRALGWEKSSWTF